MEIQPIKERIRQFRWNLDGRSIPLGLGCAWLSDMPGEDPVDILAQCYDLGIRYYDTSRSYRDSEVILGELIKTIDRRTIFLATKSKFPYREANGFEMFKQNFYESFERLRTDHIDLYQIHDTECFDCCLEQVIPFLQDRRKEGLIDYIGMGTRSLTAHQQAIASGLIDSALSYTDYSLLKKPAKPLIELTRRKGAAFINASVLLFGLLKGADNSQTSARLTVQQRKRREFAKSMRDLCREMGVNIIDAALQESLWNPDIDMTLNGIHRRSNLESTLRAMRAAIYPEQWAAILELQRTCDNFEIEDEYRYEQSIPAK